MEVEHVHWQVVHLMVVGHDDGLNAVVEALEASRTECVQQVKYTMLVGDRQTAVEKCVLEG